MPDSSNSELARLRQQHDFIWPNFRVHHSQEYVLGYPRCCTGTELAQTPVATRDDALRLARQIVGLAHQRLAVSQRSRNTMQMCVV